MHTIHSATGKAIRLYRWSSLTALILLKNKIVVFDSAFDQLLLRGESAVRLCLLTRGLVAHFQFG